MARSPQAVPRHRADRTTSPFHRAVSVARRPLTGVVGVPLTLALAAATVAASQPAEAGPELALAGYAPVRDADTQGVDGPRLPVDLDGVDAPTVMDGQLLEPRSTRPSRAGERQEFGPLVAKAKPRHRRFAASPVYVRVGPGKRYKSVDTLPFRDHVGVTGLKSGKWQQVKWEGRSLWVHSDFLVKNRPPKPEPKPAPAAAAAPAGSARTAAPSPSGVSTAPCANGVADSGTANTIGVIHAVCALWPQLTTYGTYRGDGEHAQGRAVDIMISDGGTGQAIADYVRAHAGELNVEYIIYAQHIWSVERSGEGWRPMEDRGSATANHYDHVHVTTY